MSKLVLIDGNAIMHRAYHALPPLTTKSGEPINAVYGFVSMLLGLINDLKPTHLAVCFDRPEETFRRKKFVKYQAQRPEMDDFLSSQIVKMHDVLSAFSIPVYEKAGFEADDLLGTIAKKTQNFKGKNESEKINETIIVTGDRDIFQLINKNVKVYVPVKGLKEGKLYGEEEVKSEFDFNPVQIIDYKALVGDASDNYPGVAGVGPKTARDLIVTYKTVENIFKNIDKLKPPVAGKLKGKKDDAVFFKEIATIVTDVPVDIDFNKMGDWDLGGEEAINLFMSYGFKTLLRRITAGKNGFDTSSLLNPESTKKKLSLNEVEEMAVLLAGKLNGRQYALRGSASLLLQGIVMGVDDIDVVCDEKSALSFNEKFKKEMVEAVKFSENDQFRSFFGKFVVKNVLVEVMGQWQIKDGSGKWQEVYDASDDEINEIEIKGKKVRVTKPETELKCFAQMQRWVAFQKIKKQLDAKSQGSLF